MADDRRIEFAAARFGIDVSVRHVAEFASTYKLPLVSVRCGRAELEWAALGDHGCVCIDRKRVGAMIEPSFGTVGELVAARPELVGACVVLYRHGDPGGDDPADSADRADVAEACVLVSRNPDCDEDDDGSCSNDDGDDDGDEGGADDDEDDEGGVDDDDDDGSDHSSDGSDYNPDLDASMDAIEMLQPAALLVLDARDERDAYCRFDDFLYGDQAGYVMIHETRIDEPAARWTVDTGNHAWVWLQAAPPLPKLVAPCGPVAHRRLKLADELCIVC